VKPVDVPLASYIKTSGVRTKYMDHGVFYR